MAPRVKFKTDGKYEDGILLMKNAETDILQQAMSGSRSAFGKLVELHQEKVLYLAYDLMGDWDDAKDAAQETFIRAFQKLSRFEGKSRFSSWLYRITVNLCMDIHRKRKRQATDALDAETEENLPDLKENGSAFRENTLEYTELKGEIDAALTTVSINQRTAVVLKFFHELSVREIADIMECSESTVRIHLFRAMKRLKETLREVA